MVSERITFLNRNLKFAGTLYLPEGQPPFPAVVVVHPASAGEQTHPFYDHLKSALPEHGIAVLVFDRRGSSSSEGEFETASFEDLAGDVIAAVEYLEARADIDKAKIGLHGTSQGGWIAPIAAARKPEVAAVVAVSACGVTPALQMDYGVAFHLRQEGYDSSVIAKVLELRGLVNEYFRGHLTRDLVAASLRRYESQPWFGKGYLYSSHELPVDVTQGKWHYEMDYEPLSIWKEVTQPTLFVFAETDEWVPIDASLENYRNATAHLSDVTFRQIRGTNHLMSTSGDEHFPAISPAYLSLLLEWLARRLKRSQDFSSWR